MGWCVREKGEREWIFFGFDRRRSDWVGGMGQ